MSRDVIKTIRGQNGKFYILSGGNRYKIAECEARIEITEKRKQMIALGGNVILKRYASILVTFDHRKVNMPLPWEAVDGVGLQGEFLRKDGKYEIFDFSHLLLASDLDLTADSECEFEIQCSDETMAKLRRM